MEQRGVDQVFAGRLAQNIKVKRDGAKVWYFTFELSHPDTKEVQVFAMTTKRGTTKRTWADPRVLFAYLADRYGVSEGTFVLEEATDDQQVSPPSGSDSQ